jgi:hypothetical protein
MSDRPPLISEANSTRAEIRVLKGIVFAGLIALLLAFGARMFVIGERNGDADATQQRAEGQATAPAAGELPGNAETKRSGKPARPDLFGG